MKTIGVLGGIGPQATMQFERRLHEAAQRLVLQHQNRGYPPTVVYYVRDVPFVLESGRLRPRVPYEPNPKLLEGARLLGTVADFLVILSNATHLLQDHIERAAGRPVLSMIDLVLREVQRRGWRRVGVLGLDDPVVYTTPLDELGIAHETIHGLLRGQLDRHIFASMEGQSDPTWTAGALDAVEVLRGRGVDGVILGCTEIPILLGEQMKRFDGDESVIDPIEVLAEAAVRHATA